ncbi:MAG: PaaI family thioesterase [Elusimicrobiota bacterium]
MGQTARQPVCVVPRVDPPEGWRPTNPFDEFPSAGLFISQDGSDGYFRVRYFKRDKDAALMALAWFGPNTQGPPEHAHGGSISAVLDESLGAAAWLAGYRVVTMRLVTEFRKMIPLQTDTLVETKIERVDRRKVVVSGQITDRKGQLFATGTGFFIRLDSLPTKDALGLLKKKKS